MVAAHAALKAPLLRGLFYCSLLYSLSFDVYCECLVAKKSTEIISEGASVYLKGILWYTLLFYNMFFSNLDSGLIHLNEQT